MSQKGLAPILVVLIAFVLLSSAGGVYYFSKNQHSQTTTKSTKPEPINTGSEEWNTYTNKNYGFTFKYPNLTFGEGICGQRRLDDVAIRILELSDNTNRIGDSSCYNYNYAIFFYVNKEPETVENRITLLKNDLQLKDDDFTIDDYRIGNKTVKRLRVLKVLSEYTGQVYEEYYFYNDLESKLLFSVYVEYIQQEYKNITSKILSTLIFDSSFKEVTIKTPFYKYFPKEAFTTPNFIKRNYGKNTQSSYITKEYYYTMDKISDDNLVNFKCSYNIYEDYKSSSYRYNISDKKKYTKTFEIPIGEQLFHLLRSNPRIDFRSFQYCLTDDDKEFILATYDGGPLQLVQVGGDKIDIKAKDSEITGWYFGCRDILAITKDNNFYVSCRGGDTAIEEWINRIDANTGAIEKISGCFIPHSESGDPIECWSS